MPEIKQTPRTIEEKRTRVRILLGNLIVQVDPRNRHASTLAMRIGVSRQYLNNCIDLGRCGRPLAERLQKEFGKIAAPVDELCWNLLDH